MNCNKANIDFLNFLDGTLSESTQEAIKEHLATCNACKEKFENIKEIYTSIETQKDEFKENPFLAAKVWDRLQDKSKTSAAPIIAMRKSAIATLAAAGIAIGITIGTLFNTWVSERNSYEQINSWTQIAEDYLPSEMFSPYDNLEINE
ncbi:MAG TPA: zf-HC2 domain-containing protein [Perlabentimonas sp.]|jgi:anti-sigma factor RsiW|nr:zf-HC2 domain-containing protein [Bacteroidales bacterium]MDD4673557.1 zf-HC2 domain-containing protein [Bacteroidales bacterium]MDY0349106.1 zf-HC2 domain-containing protein [Tenuifilaceae bacterium]HZJ73762.1 zf-HC2 domain-containing protein [Perlabentimonas sp.]